MANDNAVATLTTANGIARHVQIELKDLIPSKNLKFTKRIPYDKSAQLGADILQPVVLTGEHGVTYVGSSSEPVQLGGAVVAESRNATFDATGFYFQSKATIDFLARCVAMGERAAAPYIALMMKNVKKGANKRGELKYVHGGLSLGTVSSATAPTTTTMAAIMTESTWASGVWLGMKNALFDAYNGATKLNVRGDLKITKNTPKTFTVTFEGNADDITAILAIGTAGSGVEFYEKGSYGKTGYGLVRLAKLAAADTYLGITCASYPDVFVATQMVWDRVTQPNFTWDDMQNGVEEYIGRGGENDLIVEVPPNVWTSLNSSLDALRVFDSSYSKTSVDMGHDADAIKYHSLGIDLTIECSTFMKKGEVVAFPDDAADPDVLSRRGSTDVTFNVPGQGEDMFLRVPGTNFCEWMAYSCNDVYTTSPRGLIYWGPSF